MSYFRPYSCSKNEIEVQLDLPNYSTKSDLNAAGITSQIHQSLLRKVT